MEIRAEHTSTGKTLTADVVPTHPEPDPADPGRHRGVLVLPWVAVGGLVALSVALYLGLLDRVPLLNRPAAVTIECLGAATLVASWLPAGRRWLRRTLPIMLGAVVVATVLIAVVLWQTGTVTDAYPPTFGVWVATALLALAGVPVGLRIRWSPARITTADRVRRLTAILAVPLTVVGALMLINGEYGIWPQVSDLLGYTRTLPADALPGPGAPAQHGSATGDTECVNGPQGNAETYLTVDVPAFLTTNLHVTSDPARWGVVGFSEGGTCAVDLFVSHTDLFHHVVDLGGDLKPSLGNSQHTLTALFGGSVAEQQAHDPLRVMQSRHYTGVSAWFAGGTQDHYAITAAQRLSAAAQNAGITEHQLTLTGGHSWQFAAAAFAQILPALCVDLGCGDTRTAPLGSVPRNTP